MNTWEEKKTAELTGAALDWAVAKCEGHNVFIKHAPVQVMYTPKGKRSWYIFTPSTNWAQGGPIIEREGISVSCWAFHSMPWKAVAQDSTDLDVPLYKEYGETPLIAAMRCYVASKLGDEVEIPTELTQGESK
jgi:hypothetical protein